MDALQRAAARSDDVRGALAEATDRIVSTANAMGSGTHSGGHGYEAKGTGTPRKGQGWLEHENSPAPVTGPAAHYDGNVRMFHDGYMGIVYTANYSAQLDNHKNNTLLKAKG
jgi:hypothetical protein